MSLWYCDRLIKKALFLLAQGQLIKSGNGALLPFSSWMYKFFSRSDKHRYYLELRGNLAAQSCSFLGEFIVPTKPIPFGFLMRRGQPTTSHELDTITAFLDNKLAQLQEHNSPPVLEWLDLSTISLLTSAQPSIQTLESTLRKQLDGLAIPMSPAHGDLHLGNIIFIDQQLRLIDWSMYRTRSSFLLDVVHFHIRQLCDQTEKSWTEVVFMPIPAIAKLASEFRLTQEQLKLLYAINRCSLESEQYGGAHRLNRHKTDKYLRLLEKLPTLIRPVEQQ